MSDSKKLILKGFLYTSIGLIFSKIFTYGWRIIAARVGVEEYGMLSIVLAVMSFLVPFGALGLGAAIERYVSYYIGKNDIVGVKSTIVNSLKVSVFFSIFVAFCLFFSSDFLASSVFKNPDLGILLKLFSVFIPLLVLDMVITPLFRVYNRLDYFTFVKYMLEASLKFALALLLIYLGYGIFGVAFAYLVSIGLSAILLFYFSRKHCFDFMKNTMVIRNNISELL
ncbi:MAG: oligosaccharide flippase family protein, partial [archaeon]|nr:oligosaccharide flippase family protein [archaeon]